MEAIIDKNTSTIFGLNSSQRKSGHRGAIDQAWQKIAPHWPLENFVASNPLQGLEHLPFEIACQFAADHYQVAEIPDPLALINIQTIKWSLAFFDQGQATFEMPDRQLGLFKAWLELAIHDQQLVGKDQEKKKWLSNLTKEPEWVIAECLDKLQVPHHSHAHFLTLMLTTLPGWAGHVKYRAEWSASHTKSVEDALSLDDYLAMRLVITTLIWKEASSLLDYFPTKKSSAVTVQNWLNNLNKKEEKYASTLLRLLIHQAKSQSMSDKKIPLAQIVFCIDVRSEPFRRALEAQGNYETYGFAGFFGVPVQIQEYHSGKMVSSCPVLISPQHTITEIPQCTVAECQRDKVGEETLQVIKQCYHGMKYSFSTHFALVEAMGLWSGLWMMLKTLTPKFAAYLKKSLREFARPPVNTSPHIQGWNGLPEKIDTIDLNNQCTYAISALRMMGLTSDFAPVVILCGHGSTTENNAYAAALNCGACGGRHGGVNAQILAKILNNSIVRKNLGEQGILIPDKTLFIPALHNTTTDNVIITTPTELNNQSKKIVEQLQLDCIEAQRINTQIRCQKMHHGKDTKRSIQDAIQRSVDWAQTRPEWGLARNASFIIGPRWLTKNIDGEGRLFLHSYEWESDPQAVFLRSILTAPVIVAQWINNQYLFSTIDNISYGAGSKVTQNVAGKIGVMQGNASDLMHGLPLQSVYETDINQYHEPLRLLVIIYAPHETIGRVINNESILQKLLGNGWIKLAAIDPKDKKCYHLNRELSWRMAE